MNIRIGVTFIQDNDIELIMYLEFNAKSFLWHLLAESYQWTTAFLPEEYVCYSPMANSSLEVSDLQQYYDWICYIF